MKKITTLIIAALMTTTALFAGITEDIATGNAMRANADYASAITTYALAITNNPNADVNDLAICQTKVAEAYRSLKDYERSNIEAELVLTTYPTTNDQTKAFAVFILARNHANLSTDYSEAITLYDSIITDYPNASASTSANALNASAALTALDRNYTGAIMRYRKVNTEYPTAHINIHTTSILGIIKILERQLKYSQVQTECERFLIDYESGLINHRISVQLSLANAIRMQGNDASAEYLKITNYGDSKILRDGVSTFGQYMNEPDYKAYLTKILMILPAIYENAEFLGRVKSQLEILK